MYSARLASTGDAMLSLGASLDLATKAISEGLGIDLTEQDFRILETAAQVFKHASGELLRRCKKKQAKGFMSSSNGLWRGQDGYSMDRWQFWKDKLSTLTHKVAFEKIKERLEGVIEIMNEMEQ